jgi:hypothetical protein
MSMYLSTFKQLLRDRNWLSSDAVQETSLNLFLIVLRVRRSGSRQLPINSEAAPPLPLTIFFLAVSYTALSDVTHLALFPPAVPQ